MVQAVCLLAKQNIMPSFYYFSREAVVLDVILRIQAGCTSLKIFLISIFLFVCTIMLNHVVDLIET